MLVDEIAATGGRVHAKRIDITDEGAVQARMSRVRERFGSIDILVNNAALFGDLDPWPSTS